VAHHAARHQDYLSNGKVEQVDLKAREGRLLTDAELGIDVEELWAGPKVGTSH
jgi:hypothetical protein